MKIYGGELIASGSTAIIPITGLATTGSNIFIGTETVSGSANISGSLRINNQNITMGTNQMIAVSVVFGG
jgi:hypothetical protein